MTNIILAIDDTLVPHLLTRVNVVKKAFWLPISDLIGSFNLLLPSVAVVVIEIDVTARVWLVWQHRPRRNQFNDYLAGLCRYDNASSGICGG